MKITPPTLEDLNKYYQNYWKYLSGNDLLDSLEKQTDYLLKLSKTIPGDKEDFRYAEGKWMLKEVIGHLSDAERILSYRALRFARNDQTELAGFDENKYMEESNFKNLPLKDILKEWINVRNATYSLFSNLDVQALDKKGISNGNLLTPRILLYFIVTHEKHHVEIIKDKYLSI